MVLYKTEFKDATMKWTKQEKIMVMGKTGTVMIILCLSVSPNNVENTEQTCLQTEHSRR